MSNQLGGRDARHEHRARLLAAAFLIVLAITGCGGREQQGTKIAWQPGTPPTGAAAAATSRSTAATDPAAASTLVPVPRASTARRPAPSATAPPRLDGTAEQEGDRVASAPLTPEQLAEYRPNELGVVPVLMYHVFIEARSTDEAYTMTLADFRAELQRLYDLDYYVIPLRDLYLNRIAAPPGKHPVALTFDDGTVGQFRYLIDDGAVTIDPNSAVGILEAFFAAHPDFGRGGFFAVPPVSCFDWQGAETEPDQTPYCAQKLRWLLDNGYEVGNHTLDHADLLDLDDATFKAKVGGGMTELRAYEPEVTADILAMPFGNYPDPETRQRQREWLRNGFEYDGTEIELLGALMVGANPAPAPVSTEWDPLYVPRIQAYDGEYGSTEWLSILEDDPSQLYTSDGNPDTVTIPATLPPALEGTFDPAKAEGKEVIEYDLPTAE